MSRDLERRLARIESARSPRGPAYVVLSCFLTDEQEAAYREAGVLPPEALADDDGPPTEVEWLALHCV
jgi:hypothetical protein